MAQVVKHFYTRTYIVYVPSQYMNISAEEYVHFVPNFIWICTCFQDCLCTYILHFRIFTPLDTFKFIAFFVTVYTEVYCKIANILNNVFNLIGSFRKIICLFGKTTLRLKYFSIFSYYMFVGVKIYIHCIFHCDDIGQSFGSIVLSRHKSFQLTNVSHYHDYGMYCFQ